MSDYERDRRVREAGDRGVDRTRPMTPYDDMGEPEEDLHERRRRLYGKIANVVWSIIGFIEALIGLRVLLKLIAANPDNGFVSFIYGLSGFFVNPFLGIVNDPQSGRSVLEINSLIAMVIYLLVGYGVLRLIWLIFSVTEPTES